MIDRFPPAPTHVKAACALLVAASGLGIVLTIIAAWATQTVPAGLSGLLDSLSRDDRYILRQSWVLHLDQPIPLLANLSALIWLGLAYLPLLPLAYYVRRGFGPARTATYVIAGLLMAATFVATITDEDFVTPHQTDGPGLDQLSAGAHQAWLELFPPGYAGIHDTALVGMIAALFVACALIDRADARVFFQQREPRRRTVRASHPRLRTDPPAG
jgi:hypothetical protein